MSLQLAFIACVIYFATLGCKSNIDSNPGPLQANVTGTAERSTFFNSIEHASFKYTRSELFKTGKVPAPHLTLSADSTIHYGGTKYSTRLKYYDIEKGVFGFGSLTTSNSTVLLFTQHKQFHSLEVKGAGAFAFTGVKDGNYYFRLTMKGATTSFSLNLSQPDIRITEYTIEGE